MDWLTGRCKQFTAGSGFPGTCLPGVSAILTRTHKSGFSLIEALVVLAIGGMALAIVFSIGTKAGDVGFGLGRRAMTVAEKDLAISDVRTIVRSIALRPRDTFVAGVDRPTVGASARLETDVVMERATQCAPRGWSGRLVLEIKDDRSMDALVCEADGASVTLMRFPKEAGRISYSANGAAWTEAYVNTPAENVDRGTLKPEAVFIRFSMAGDDIIELASSGRAQPWLRRGEAD